MRRQRQLPLEELQPLLFPDTPRGTEPTPIVWEAVFGNAHPVEIEVGFGKGLFLLSSATAHPEVNYFGIEIVRKYQLFSATRLIKHGLSNVRLACGDAKIFLRDRIAKGSVQTVHVYFPDPWWKTRHHKRRLFTPDFVEFVLHVLKPQGHFSIATDVADYFMVMQQLLAEMASFLPIPLPSSATENPNYLTNFERKFRLQGKPIYRALYEKR